MKRIVAKFVTFLFLVATLSAQEAHAPAFKETMRASLPAGLPDYKGSGQLTGSIRSVGADTMEQVTKSWLETFKKNQAGINFTIEAKASGTAGPALTDGTADVGPVAREMLPAEEDAFVKKWGYKPTAFRVASGSYRTPGKTHAITFYVHKDNPISKLSFAELDAIFSTTRKHGHAAVTTWGDLGLKGEWADKKISLWGLIRPNGIAHYVQEMVMDGGDFKDGINERTTVGNLPALDAIVQGIEKDRYAIGYSGFSNATPGVKAIPLAVDIKGPYYQGTFDEVVNHKYPLSRFVYIYVNKAPGKKLDPIVREYLSLILSKEGQQAVVQEGIFLPLPADLLRKERAKLDQK
jgi:phosphate transport system substrate-binding protein